MRRLIYNDDVAVGQLAVFQGGPSRTGSRSVHIWIHTDRGPSRTGGSNAEKQPTGRGPKGCVENGPAAALLLGHVSLQICSLLLASPARTALPTAHFERNDIIGIYETVH